MTEIGSRLPKAKIHWTSGGGIMLITCTLLLVLFAVWSLMLASDLKGTRRHLSERNHWLEEVNTALELIETPPLRTKQKGTMVALEKLANELENLRLSLVYAYEPSEKLNLRLEVTIAQVIDTMKSETPAFRTFRKQTRRNLQRARGLIRTDIVERASIFAQLAKRLNQALSATVVLVGFCLILLMNLALRNDQTKQLAKNFELIVEERDLLARSELQHYRMTFSSITDNLPHGVVVHRRDEVLFANKTLMNLIRPGAEKWEDVEPELDLLVERIKKARQHAKDEFKDPSRVTVEARRFDGSSVMMDADEDLATIFRGGDAQMVFVYRRANVASEDRHIA